MAGAMGIVQVWATLFFSPGCSQRLFHSDSGATSDEAHVSAAQEEAKEHTRVSRAHGEQEWPEGSGPASGSRA